MLDWLIVDPDDSTGLTDGGKSIDLRRYGITRTFCEIFPTFDDFKATRDEMKTDIPDNLLKEGDIRLIYFILLSNYGNTPIANMIDEYQFAYRVMLTIWQYAPTWERRVQIQEELRKLTIDQLKQGSKAIYNHAFNPGSEPSTGSLQELNYINEQNTTNYKKSDMESYAMLTSLLETDVTQEFVDKFKRLFMTGIYYSNPYRYTDC